MRLRDAWVVVVASNATLACSENTNKTPQPVALTASSMSSTPASERNLCAAAPVRNEAMDAPAKHAWDLFLTLNHPARDIRVARGVPDCTKALGSVGTTSVWETWRLARTEVFLKDGSEPPAWEDTSIPGALFGQTPAPPSSAVSASPHDPPLHDPRLAAMSGTHVLFDPIKDQGVFEGRGGIGETHVNKSTYDFIKQNCLWSYDGLSRYAKAVDDGKKPPLSFPPESMEVKAVWVKFKPEDMSAGKAATYYTATADGATYGLTAFHILTKDVPNWFWATFHHKDEPANSDETPSTFPQPSAVRGTVWSNYELGGVQTDFTDPTGNPTILSDYYIEFGFTKSSCITCHASGHGHPEPPRDTSGKLVRDARGRIAAAQQGPLQTTDIGIPNSTLFQKNGKPYFVQTDFLWSIPFRAQEELRPPPDRCRF